MDNWISVEDRLPGELQDVLVNVRYANSNNIHLDYLIFKSNENSEPEWETYAHSCVTHWMPLPEPPTGGN